MITETIEMPTYNVDYLKKAIDKINRKARKMGCDALELTFGDTYIISYDEHPITGHVLVSPLRIEMVSATLTYNIPMIEGYELIAKLDIYPSMNGGEDTVLISAVPDKVVPDEYKNLTAIHCDHCGWKRNRHHAVLLRNTEDGKHIQVGSTCVKDFFGIDPKGFLLMASIKFSEIIGKVKEDHVPANYGRDIWGYDLDHVLAYSAAATVKWGWLSKSKAWELNNRYENAQYVPTAEHVLDNLNPWPRMPEELKVDIEEEDLELANKVIEHFKNLDPKDNDYLLQCCKIVEMGYVPHKYIGYACSMVGAYNRDMEKKVKMEKEQEVNGHSKFQGELKERLKGIRVEVTYKRNFVNDFGENTLYAFRDADGNIYKTFYSGYSWECEVGDVVLLTGTVKKHQEFRGIEETMMNRVVVADAPEELFSNDEFKVA